MGATPGRDVERGSLAGSPGARDTGSRAVRLVFIVNAARSGSTMLRYLLDSHSQVIAPAESDIAVAATALLTSWSQQGTPSSAGERRERGLREVRRAVMALARYNCGASGKAIFCDKSLSTVDNYEAIVDALPRSRFILLYRHVMDVVASAIEMSRWGFNQFGIGPYVPPTNFVAGLSAYWCHAVERMLKLEGEQGSRCVRVHYENLARHTDVVLCDICRFIGIEWEEKMMNGLAGSHLPGPGDPKVDFTKKPHTASIGRGIEVPASLIPADLRQRMNRLLEALGYPTVEDDWNSRASSPFPNLAAPEVGEVAEELDSLFRRHLGDLGLSGLCDLTLVAEGLPGAWVVDGKQRKLRRDAAVPSSAPVLVTARPEAYKGVASGKDNIALLFARNELRLHTNQEHPQAILKQLNRLLSGPGSPAGVGDGRP